MTGASGAIAAEIREMIAQLDSRPGTPDTFDDELVSVPCPAGVPQDEERLS